MVTADHRPTVSVIIPTYNWSSALACALRSVQLQTFQDFEVLVVGDGCTDDSEAVVASFNDRRFKWHNLERNHGNLWAPTNHALANARGGWIAYLAHDDLWYPTHIELGLRTALEQNADIAAGVTVLYGPPGSGHRGVTGVFLDGQFSPYDHVAFPSLLHRRSLIDRIGAWPDSATIALPSDCEFVQRAAAANVRIVSTEQLTVFKPSAAWRRDSYARKDSAQQRELLAKIESGTDFRQAELLDVYRAVLSGSFFRVGMPSTEDGAGYFHRRNRHIKGFAAAYAAAELKTLIAPRRYFLTNLIVPFEWHEIETHEVFGEYRWMGPLARASLDLPVRFDQDLLVRIHVIAALRPEQIETATLFINDKATAFTREITAEGTSMLALAAVRAEHDIERQGLRVSLEVEKTVRPYHLGINQDTRALGLAVNWIEVGPLAQPLNG